MRTFSGVSANNPVPIETTSFSSAESEDGYMSTRNVAIQLMQQQQQLYVGYQPQTGGEMMQRPQGMRERNRVNHNVPVDPTGLGYSSCPPGMRLMHPPVHYEQPPGICMVNQPPPLTMHNMTQEQQECQYPHQPDRWQPQSGSEMIQNPQEMTERDHVDQNIPVAPTGYSNCPPGMRLMHPPVHYEQSPGVRMVNQPTPQLTMHNMTQQQEQQECQYPRQPDRWQPQSGGEMMQRSRGMKEGNYVNHSMPRGVRQPDPTGYPRFQPVMDLMQPPAHYGPHSGMGMPRMINQPTPRPALYNMPQSGGSMMQRHPHMGSHPGMVHPPMNPPPFMTRGMQPGTTVMQLSGEHCQMMTHPYTSVVSSLHHPPSHLPVVSHFLSETPSTFFSKMFQTPQRPISGPRSSVSHLVIQDKSKITPHKRNLHSQCDKLSKRPINPLLSLPLSSASLVNSETVIVSPNDSSGFVYYSVDVPISSEHQYERKKSIEEEQKNGRKSPKQVKTKEPPDIAQCKITSSAFKNVSSLVVVSSDHKHNVMTTQESLVRQGHLYFKDHSRKQSNEIACCSDTINQQLWKKGWADGWVNGWMDASKGLPLNPEIPFNYKNLPPELTRPSSLPNFQLTNMFSQNTSTQSVQEGNVTGTHQSIDKIFQTYFDDLCVAIEAYPLRIVNKLISSQLIDSTVRKDVTDMQSAYQKANKIVMSIESCLKGNNNQLEYLQKFCDFLQNKVDYRILNNIGAKMGTDCKLAYPFLL